MSELKAGDRVLVEARICERHSGSWKLDTGGGITGADGSWTSRYFRADDELIHKHPGIHIDALMEELRCAERLIGDASRNTCSLNSQLFYEYDRLRRARIDSQSVEFKEGDEVWVRATAQIIGKSETRVEPVCDEARNGWLIRNNDIKKLDE